MQYAASPSYKDSPSYEVGKSPLLQDLYSPDQKASPEQNADLESPASKHPATPEGESVVNSPEYLASPSGKLPGVTPTEKHVGSPEWKDAQSPA